ncbi:MAG: hypothetical protein ACRELV_00025 [Longimicrobiales bacterium]
MAAARIRHALHLRAALIVTLAWGCDNVDWGGMDAAIVPPPPKGETPVAGVDSLTGLLALPTGPILYYVRVGGEAASMIPVAEVAGDSLRRIDPGANWEEYDNRFIAEHLRQGSEFTLFHGGRRAGTFVVESAVPPPMNACPRLPLASGALELSQRADSTREFIAMARREAPEPTRIPVDLQPTVRMQVVGPILAERQLRARQQQLPGNWRFAMKQIYPFPVQGAADPGFTATLMVGDELARGGDFGTGSGVAYSLFFIALPTDQASFDTAFTRFSNYSETGDKAAPRTIDFLDWDRDGQAELLLYVYGQNAEWFAAVGNTEAEDWGWIYSGRCDDGGAPAALANVPAADTTALPGSAEQGAEAVPR